MDPRLQYWLRIPAELRERNQWCVAAPDKSPWYITSELSYKADVSNPNTWMSFEQAVSAALLHNAAIGYVLACTDPFTCIDLDVKDAENAPDKPHLWTTPQRMSEFWQAVQAFDSYAERSRSGKGYHIWIRGQADRALKMGDTEVYTTERFIISTGRVVLDRGIVDRQAMLTSFLAYHRQKQDEEDKTLYGDEPEREDDWSILLRVHNSAQREKFENLWLGKIDDYPSQSEADASLLQILCYYSPNNTQVGRLFLESALGKREKAYKSNFLYLRRSLARARSIRNHELRAEQAMIERAKQLVKDTQTGKQVSVEAVVQQLNREHQQSHTPVISLHSANSANVREGIATPDAEAIMSHPVSAGVLSATDGIAWPPGITGRIAQFIFDNSIRPIKEVSIVAAIGLMAGLCGKGWHIPQSGLNMYVVLVARSAVGKEAMHTGISVLLNAALTAPDATPYFADAIEFTEYQSGPALIKRCAEASSFVNVLGEWGKKLKRMANGDVDGPISTLRTQMTNLYQKSGPQSTLGGMGYSSEEKNTKSVTGVAYSMIGETTPETYYEALTPSMMEDGFLSRFLMIEYRGKRVPMNRQPMLVPPEALVTHLVKLAKTALRNNANSVLVQANDEARSLINQYEQQCDNEINKTEDESRRQMWNRASLKSMRLAALLAVGDNFEDPVITKEHVNWAQTVVNLDIANMARKLNSGDVGTSDQAREAKLLAVIRNYVLHEPPRSFKVNGAMRDNGIITRSYLNLRLTRASAFANTREGSARALDNTLRNAVENGYLIEVTKTAMFDGYNFTGKAYRILEIPDNLTELEDGYDIH